MFRPEVWEDEALRGDVERDWEPLLEASVVTPVRGSVSKVLCEKFFGITFLKARD